jgi:alpha/beta superfamily hydrolase
MINKNIKVVFSHGQESTPTGNKILVLSKIAKEKGFTVDSIDYRAIKSPDDRVKFLIEQDLNSDGSQIILVGSSMGAYTSLVASEQINPLGVFLLAPALYIDRYMVQTYPIPNVCEIIHGWDDDIISFNNSIKFANIAKCSLHLIDGDHRLESSLDKVKQIFSEFLNQF